MVPHLLSLVLLFAAGSAFAQPPYAHFAEHWARAGVLVTLAPACGLRDADWARRLERGVAHAQRHDLTPQAEREGLAAAAFAVTAGTRLFQRFGPAICRDGEDALSWRDVARLVAGAPDDEAGLPTLPDTVPGLGWRAVLGELAVRCGLRDREWGRAAGAGLRRSIAMAEGMEGDPHALRGVARAVTGLAGTIAARVQAVLRADACDGLRRDADLAAVDEAASEWRRLCRRRRRDASCTLDE